MSHYHHLSMNQREKILILYTEKKSIHAISKAIGRSVSTVSRELKRNHSQDQAYSAIEAQKEYQKRRKKCRRPRLLNNTKLRNIVARLFLEYQWSPEQIANRFVRTLLNPVANNNLSSGFNAAFAPPSLSPMTQLSDNTPISMRKSPGIQHSSVNSPING